MTHLRSAALSLLMLLLMAASAVGEDLPRDLELVHTLALADSGASRLEFDLAVPYQRLVFRREGGGFEARVRVAVRARDKKTKREESLLFTDGTHSGSFAESRRKDLSFEKDFHMELGPGRWQVDVSIFARGAERPWTAEFEVVVPDSRAGDLYLQGPRWLGTPDAEITPPFYFRDPWAIPSDRARFVDASVSRLGLECRLHSWSDQSRAVQLLMRLESAAGELVHYDRRSLELGAGERLLRWELPVDRLTMGAYLLVVELFGPEERQGVRGRLDVGLTRAAFEREWDRSVDLLAPLAESDEQYALTNAPPNLRRERWREFWARREPLAAEPWGPALEAFCERITDANTRFGSLQRPGYASDRGRVYLEHGAPDRTERYEDERYYRTLESWTYTRLGLLYVFEDRHGAGEFTLLSVSGS